MHITWQIDPEEIQKIRAFCEQHQENPFVKLRIQRNLQAHPPEVSRQDFWYAMATCLLTTQQRSGPSSSVARFIRTRPFPLRHEVCAQVADLRSHVYDVLSSAQGIRRFNRIADEMALNFRQLEDGLWNTTLRVANQLRERHTPQDERLAAEFIDDHFKGFGPKQSRNLLQSLGLSRYEIPIDSRITKWLNSFGFPVTLSAASLVDRNYYNLVSDGIQALCLQSDIYPCVLDAAIFASFDKGAWTEENAVL
jgi:hypothetical protein